MEKATELYCEEYEKKFKKLKTTEERYAFWERYNLFHQHSLFEGTVSFIDNVVEKLESKWGGDICLGNYFPTSEIVDFLESMQDDESWITQEYLNKIKECLIRHNACFYCRY